MIDMQEPVALTFALRYLNSFAKATPLSPQARPGLGGWGVGARAPGGRARAPGGAGAAAARRALDAARCDARPEALGGHCLREA